MPVLLLAQGDPKAKDLLRRAIEARYGQRPPALDTFHAVLKGSLPGKIGPLPLRLGVTANVYFRFPSAVRWEWQAKLLGISLQRGAMTLNGDQYHPQTGAAAVSDPTQVASAQAQLWAAAALLLMPLGDQISRLATSDGQSLEATNTKTNASAVLQLRPDYSLDSVQTKCINPANGQQQTLILRLNSALTALSDLNVPTSIKVYWDNTPSFELSPVSLESNPTLAPEIFP